MYKKRKIKRTVNHLRKIFIVNRVKRVGIDLYRDYVETNICKDVDPDVDLCIKKIDKNLNHVFRGTIQSLRNSFKSKDKNEIKKHAIYFNTSFGILKTIYKELEESIKYIEDNLSKINRKDKFLYNCFNRVLDVREDLHTLEKNDKRIASEFDIPVETLLENRRIKAEQGFIKKVNNSLKKETEHQYRVRINKLKKEDKQYNRKYKIEKNKREKELLKRIRERNKQLKDCSAIDKRRYLKEFNKKIKETRIKQVKQEIDKINSFLLIENLSEDDRVTFISIKKEKEKQLKEINNAR